MNAWGWLITSIQQSIGGGREPNGEVSEAFPSVEAFIVGGEECLQVMNNLVSVELVLEGAFKELFGLFPKFLQS